MDDNDLIFSYSRKEAIEDGTLVDISSLAIVVGFKLNTCITEAVHNTLQMGLTDPMDVDTRTKHMLVQLLYAIRQDNERKDVLSFKVRLPGMDDQLLQAKVGPGDDPTPVLTIMYPGED